MATAFAIKNQMTVIAAQYAAQARQGGLLLSAAHWSSASFSVTCMHVDLLQESTCKLAGESPITPYPFPHKPYFRTKPLDFCF